MAERGSKKVANSLVVVSSAAVLAVYAAGYSRTSAAAARLDVQSSAREHRPLPPPPPVAVSEPIGDAPAPASEPVHVAVAKPQPLPSAPAAPVEASPVAEAVAPVVEAPVSAPAPTPPPPPPPPPAPVWKDGTYTGWGSCRHGDIQASVVIEGGRIASATIAQCLTRYSCDVIDKLPAQVVQRQSHEVDSVSGATQSADAFFFAVYEALGKAK